MQPVIVFAGWYIRRRVGTRANKSLEPDGASAMFRRGHTILSREMIAYGGERAGDHECEVVLFDAIPHVEEEHPAR